MTEKIAIDIGNSAKKYMWRNGAGVVPGYLSKGRIDQITSSVIDGNSMITVNGEVYIVGEEAIYLGRGFGLQSNEHKGTEKTLIFALYILSKLNVTDAHIMVGLPVATFARDREELKDLLSGEKQATINDRLVTFNISANVVMEPIGTYLSLVSDASGNINKNSPSFLKNMVVVDVGWTTLDIITLRTGKLGERKNSELLGVSNIFDQVWRSLEPEHGMLKANEKVDLYESIIKHPGSGLVAGGQHVKPEIWKNIGIWKRDLARNIMEAVLNTLGDSRPPLMIVTGGGALFLGDELKNEYPALVIHDNPVYANAIGFYRCLLSMK